MQHLPGECRWKEDTGLWLSLWPLLQLFLHKQALVAVLAAVLQPAAQHGLMSCKGTQKRENRMKKKPFYRKIVCSPSYFFSSPTFCYIYSTISKGRESKDQLEQDILTKFCEGLDTVSSYLYHCKADFYIPHTKPVQRKNDPDNINPTVAL